MTTPINALLARKKTLEVKETKLLESSPIWKKFMTLLKMEKLIYN